MSNNLRELKFFEYFRNLSTPVGFVFLQETHSSVDVKKMERQLSFEIKIQGQLFFPHGKTNSCGDAIDYYGKKVFRASE